MKYEGEKMNLGCCVVDISQKVMLHITSFHVISILNNKNHSFIFIWCKVIDWSFICEVNLNKD